MPPAKEAARDGNAERRILARNCQTEDRRVRGRACEREQAEDERDKRGGPDGVHGRLRALVDSLYEMRERQPTVAREGEGLAGCGCELFKVLASERKLNDTALTILEPMRNL